MCLQHGTPEEESVDPNNNQPHIVHFVGATGDTLYFVVIEQKLHVVVECQSIDCALFMLLSVHFV